MFQDYFYTENLRRNNEKKVTKFSSLLFCSNFIFILYIYISFVIEYID